jgi:hypothetical protein
MVWKTGSNEPGDENVRLFEAEQQRTRELSESLEQQRLEDRRRIGRDTLSQERYSPVTAAFQTAGAALNIYHWLP